MFLHIVQFPVAFATCDVQLCIFIRPTLECTKVDQLPAVHTGISVVHRALTTVRRRQTRSLRYPSHKNGVAGLEFAFVQRSAGELEDGLQQQ